ncbi:hypothetical protein FQN54_000157 [Arachnomyces sp. PD_36]|nr:hypothetical protein FQN54_000157 [Arachnomyces sp. PD_36]
MYLPRDLISHLYNHLLRSHHPLSPPVLILAALEPDALCACRILTTLLKRDYIPHKIQPVSGYGDLARAGEQLVRPMRLSEGGSGGIVVCMGVGGLVDLGETLGLEDEDSGPGDTGGVEVWVIDARRPWNLANVFGGEPQIGQALEESTNGARGRKNNRGVENGRISQSYVAGKGGIVVFDDGDIDEELSAEREAYCGLESMPEVDDDGVESDGSESDGEDHENSAHSTKKRKSWTAFDDDSDSEGGDERPRQRRRSNSSGSIPSSPTPHRRSSPSSSQSPDSPAQVGSKNPSTRTLRRRLLRLRRKHEATIRSYYSLGTSYSEPISSLLYSLASELGREDNDLLWLAIVGVSSLELSGRTMSGVGISNTSESGGSAGWGGIRGERIRQILRDEVRRLNPPDGSEEAREASRNEMQGVIPTTARSPTDTSIRLSPEPRFLLIRHWSLYESMLHSPYLASRLHVWRDSGLKRLHKLLAKMGVSLTQCRQNYTHMDMELKKVLRQKLLKYAPLYGLEGLVPPASSGGQTGNREGWGFVRSWGWSACLSATDVGVIVGAILEVGSQDSSTNNSGQAHSQADQSDSTSPPESDPSSILPRFYNAYDALSLTSSESPTRLITSLPLAQRLHRAILRTGTSLLSKNQIRHLRSFRMAIVKDGPDVKLFTNPGALTKLALWLGEAVRIQEREKGDDVTSKKRSVGTPLVLAGLDEDRGVYVVVGTGGGGGVVDFAALAKRREERRKKKEEKEKKKAERKEQREKRAAERGERGEDEEVSEEEADGSDDSSSGSESESDTEDSRKDRGLVRNRFGIAFQEVVQETSARVRIDSFEHCVVEVIKDDLGAFLEALSFRSVVG